MALNSIERDIERACISGETIRLRRLLCEYGDVASTYLNKKDSEGSTTLISAAERGASPAMLALLVDFGATVNAVDNEGRSSLYAGICNMPCKSITLLLRRGANPNCETKTAETPLTGAIVCKRPKVVDSLLLFGADVNYVCSDGCTALYYAIYCRSLGMLQKLLKHGANSSGVVVNGMSMIEWAIDRRSRPIVETISDFASLSLDGRNEMRTAVEKGGKLVAASKALIAIVAAKCRD